MHRAKAGAQVYTSAKTLVSHRRSQDRKVLTWCPCPVALGEVTPDWRPGNITAMVMPHPKHRRS